MQDAEAISSTREAIAGAVRAELARRKVSQQKLRIATGWSRSSLSRRLNGDVDFSLTELAVLAQAIGADPVDLITTGLHVTSGGPAVPDNDGGTRPTGGAGTGPGRHCTPKTTGTTAV